MNIGEYYRYPQKLVQDNILHRTIFTYFCNDFLFFLRDFLIFDVYLYCRDFIENYYVTVKQNNPKFPVLIRECSGVQPKVFARYGRYINVITTL